jgi:predicted transcriptional regulator of viral defense system
MNTQKQTYYNYIERYLDNIRSKGRYSFTLGELQKEFDISYRALKQSLYRLKSKNKIAQVRQGFYVIIPPEYSQQGMLPPSLFIDDLMNSLNKPYYVSLLSAAAMFGAAHQQPMEYTVIAETPAPRSITNKKLKITFLSKNNWTQDGIAKQKTNAGYINVSLPELTALDLFSYSHRLTTSQIVTILQELVEKMKVGNLTKIAGQYSNTDSIQRLGYILETELKQQKLADSLWKILEQRNYSQIPLSTKKEKKGEADNRWKVIKNVQIESVAFSTAPPI